MTVISITYSPSGKLITVIFILQALIYIEPLSNLDQDHKVQAILTFGFRGGRLLSDYCQQRRLLQYTIPVLNTLTHDVFSLDRNKLIRSFTGANFPTTTESLVDTHKIDSDLTAGTGQKILLVL